MLGLRNVFRPVFLMTGVENQIRSLVSPAAFSPEAQNDRIETENQCQFPNTKKTFPLLSKNDQKLLKIQDCLIWTPCPNVINQENKTK